MHVIVNLRGTNDSDGVFSMYDGQERDDHDDIIEWAAQQEWSTGNIGTLGISYFAMSQVEAAVVTPPHLKAIFPFATSSDLYDLARHGGLRNHDFMAGWATVLGLAASRSEAMLRGKVVGAMRELLKIPRVHTRMETLNVEAALSTIQKIIPWPVPRRAVGPALDGYGHQPPVPRRLLDGP